MRFCFIRALASGVHGQVLMAYQLRLEADCGLRAWHARVPTEANISDWPSRDQQHDMLGPPFNVSAKTFEEFQLMLQMLPY